MGEFQISKGPDPYFVQPTEPVQWKSDHFAKPIELPTQPETNVGPPDAQTQPPTSNEPAWKAPTGGADWSSPQPYGTTSLDQELASKWKSLEQAREPQRGSSAAAAIIAGTTAGLFAEPFIKATGLERLRLERLTPIESVAYRSVAAETKWFTMGGALRNAKTGFLSTLGVGGALELDKMVRGQMYEGGLNSWETTSLTVPLGIALGKGFGGKAFLAGAATVGGHLIDNALPAPDFMPEALKHLSASDGIFLGTAFAIPSKNKLATAAIVGTAWLAGNIAETFLSPPSAGDLEKRAIDATTVDESERSQRSVETAVSLFKDLGRKNEVVLEQDLGLILSDLRSKYDAMANEDKLELNRNTMIVGRALGEHYLESGTRLAISSVSEPTYILKGLDLDLGTRSLQHLMLAKKHSVQSRAVTEQLMGTEVNGKLVTDRELQELDASTQAIDQSIGKIVGEHNIPEAMKQLTDFIVRGTTSSGAILSNEEATYKTFIRDINQNLAAFSPAAENPDGTLHPDASMVTAKLLRDRALVQITMAKIAIGRGTDLEQARQLLFGTEDGGRELFPNTDIEKKYDGALAALGRAEYLAPNNPDLPQLKAITDELIRQLSQ